MSTQRFEYGYRYVGELPGNEVGPFAREGLARLRAALPGRVLVRRPAGTFDAWREAEPSEDHQKAARPEPEREVPDVRRDVG